MTLNHAHKRLLLNVPSNERRFLAKVLREQMRIIEQNNKILDVIPTTGTYETAKSYFHDEAIKAAKRFNGICEKLSKLDSGNLNFIWEEN